jgi:hypothetical protein
MGPAVAVAPDGTVYAAFMVSKGAQWYPVVVASFDHGATFPQVASVGRRTPRTGATDCVPGRRP